MKEVTKTHTRIKAIKDNKAVIIGVCGNVTVG